MTNANKNLTYQEVLEKLNCKDRATFPAEFHGYMVGIICGGKYTKNEAGFRLILNYLDDEGLLSDSTKEIAAKLMLDSFQALHDIECDFHLLLPDDEKPIAERGEALSEWCHGFLTGLGSSGFEQAKTSEQDLSEILHDVVEISKLQYIDKETYEDYEQAENAYMELVEYVRVIAMMFFIENVTETLH